MSSSQTGFYFFPAAEKSKQSRGLVDAAAAQKIAKTCLSALKEKIVLCFLYYPKVNAIIFFF